MFRIFSIALAFLAITCLTGSACPLTAVAVQQQAVVTTTQISYVQAAPLVAIAAPYAVGVSTCGPLGCGVSSVYGGVGLGYGGVGLSVGGFRGGFGGVNVGVGVGGVGPRFASASVIRGPFGGSISTVRVRR